MKGKNHRHSILPCCVRGDLATDPTHKICIPPVFPCPSTVNSNADMVKKGGGHWAACGRRVVCLSVSGIGAATQQQPRVVGVVLAPTVRTKGQPTTGP